MKVHLTKDYGLLAQSDEEEKKFFDDCPSFPASTFDNLGLDAVSVESDVSISVRWHLGLGFYYSDFDWGLIFRRIGDVENPNMFFKTRYSVIRV
jgi:hypothetical protein